MEIVACSSPKEFEKMSSKVVALNAMGVSLVSTKDYIAALHKFNDAFHAVVSAGDYVRNLPRRSSVGRRSPVSDTATFAGLESPITEHGSLLKPLILPPLTSNGNESKDLSEVGTNCLVEDAEEWIFVATMRIMFNGALCHFFSQQMSQAENLCLLALAMAQEDSCNEEQLVDASGTNVAIMMDEFVPEEVRIDSDLKGKKSSNTESQDSEMTNVIRTESSDEPDKDSRRERKSMMILIYHLLGLVQGMSAQRRRCSLSSSHQNDMIETHMDDLFTRRMEEAVDSFEDALEAAEDLFGRNTKHLTTASIYLSMGRVFLKQGCLQGARFAFETARDIYDCPRVRTTTTTGGDSNSRRNSLHDVFLDVDSLDSSLEDEQVVAMLLNNDQSMPSAPAA